MADFELPGSDIRQLVNDADDTVKKYGDLSHLLSKTEQHLNK